MDKKIPRWEPAPPTYRIVTENHIGGTYKNGQKTNVNLNVGDIGIVIAEHEIARSKILMNFTSLPGQSVYVERNKSRELSKAEAAAAAEAESLRGKTFFVKRSSGIVEPGWHLVENVNIKFDTVSGEVEVTCSNDKWTKTVFISEIKPHNLNLFSAANAKAAAEALRVSEAAAEALRVSEAAAATAETQAAAAAEALRVSEAAAAAAAAAETQAAAAAAETKAAAAAAETKPDRTRSTLSLKLRKLPDDGHYDGGKRRQIKITKKNKRSKIIGATRRSRRISCRRGKKFRLGRR